MSTKIQNVIKIIKITSTNLVIGKSEKIRLKRPPSWKIFIQSFYEINPLLKFMSVSSFLWNRWSVATSEHCVSGVNCLLTFSLSWSNIIRMCRLDSTSFGRCGLLWVHFSDYYRLIFGSTARDILQQTVFLSWLYDMSYCIILSVLLKSLRVKLSFCQYYYEKSSLCWGLISFIMWSCWVERKLESKRRFSIDKPNIVWVLGSWPFRLSFEVNFFIWFIFTNSGYGLLFEEASNRQGKACS